MNPLSTRTAAVRMGIIIVSVVALDCVVVALTRKPLFWACTIPGLIPVLTPLAIWPIIRDSAKAEK